MCHHLRPGDGHTRAEERERQKTGAPRAECALLAGSTNGRSLSVATAKLVAAGAPATLAEKVHPASCPLLAPDDGRVNGTGSAADADAGVLQHLADGRPVIHRWHLPVPARQGRVPAKCRAPLQFFMFRWRPGTAGAFRMGAEHGAFCLGCCWALMLLLFTAGVMNLLWVVALIAGFVLVEKLLTHGGGLGRMIGAVLIGAGFLVVFGEL